MTVIQDYCIDIDKLHLGQRYQPEPLHVFRGGYPTSNERGLSSAFAKECGMI